MDSYHDHQCWRSGSDFEGSTFSRRWRLGSEEFGWRGKKVCLSSMKKDLPRIKTIGCLKYGSWMIRPVPKFEAGACLLLELSPRSCLKLKTYGFRSAFKFLFSDMCILLLGFALSLFHLCSY
ncbi:hypothetical protein GQ457_18G014470 [Hibiscus cannabinus]